ncbi:hypothetical protein HL658_28075 [Azospirillum sp. RWY-5-1]|uniref:Lysozyme inhibitor LprI N-terminal domain-containing protein n=1 Tax=Azospirillum oleiclasticum TaxID=2735135 RepID=A0ABX2THZ3_9PROT|nr:HdeA/HdeB family chaperone [Azospirillum oleiclasticum]NYZ16418.1 hypothetical protein [Azospirillum oleiclasticum]NYZ23866.1 hypothetical protein [Azospirillum oleiclasticum]
MRRLAVALGAVLLLTGQAIAADDGKGVPSIDVSTISCRDATALADADTDAFASLALWLDGWLNGRINETGYHPGAITARTAAWKAACRTAPDATLVSVAGGTTAGAAAVAVAGDGGFDMAFLKCFQFIDLEAEDRSRAVAAIRWIDGWHAGALGESVVNTGGHLYMTDAALQGCMKRSYHRKNVIRVLAGKHR